MRLSLFIIINSSACLLDSDRCALLGCLTTVEGLIFCLWCLFTNFSPTPRAHQMELNTQPNIVTLKEVNQICKCMSKIWVLPLKLGLKTAYFDSISTALWLNCKYLVIVVVTLVVTAQTMSFCYELTCKPVSVAKWSNTLSEPQYLLGLSGWRPAGARDQIRVAAWVVGRLD